MKPPRCPQLFAAHVAPEAAGAPGGVPWDEGGWDVYGHDWQHYYDCMLAPVARQAVGVLERLEALMVPAAGAKSVFLSAFNRMQVRPKARTPWSRSAQKAGILKVKPSGDLKARIQLVADPPQSPGPRKSKPSGDLMLRVQRVAEPPQKPYTLTVKVPWRP